MGVVVGVQNVCVYKAGEWCSRGSLDDVLENDSIKLDWAFKYSLMKDIAEVKVTRKKTFSFWFFFDSKSCEECNWAVFCDQGMNYLHSSVIASHGFLSAMTCLVDSRFVIKICDFGVTELRSAGAYEPPDSGSFAQDFRVYLWRAPELLRQTMPEKGTQARLFIHVTFEAC